MIEIYGPKRSRALRCLWVMEELGLAYKSLPLNPHAGETRTPDYLALNPAGKVPTLVHDGFVLTESLAINGYLANLKPGVLCPLDPKSLAKVAQWSSWAITEVEPFVMSILREGRRAKEEIDASRIAGWRADIHKALALVLEPHLAGNTYLLGGKEFTLADLNVAAVLSTVHLFGVEMAQHPNVQRWLNACLARPAWLRLQDAA